MTYSPAHTSTRLALLLTVAAALVLALFTDYLDTDAPAVSAAPVVASPALVAGVSIPLTDRECDALGDLPTGPHGACHVDGTEVDVVAIASPETDQPTHPGVDLLLASGFAGEAGDHLSAVYAPVDLVLFDAAGTWTVTYDGLARCEHGASERCSGDEWLD